MLHLQQRRYTELPFLLLMDCSFSMYPVNRLFSWKVVAATLWMSAPVSWSTCSRSDSSFFQLPALTWYEHSADAMLVFERIPSTSVSLVACIHRMHQLIALTPMIVITSLHIVTSKCYTVQNEKVSLAGTAWSHLCINYSRWLHICMHFQQADQDNPDVQVPTMS